MQVAFEGDGCADVRHHAGSSRAYQQQPERNYGNPHRLVGARQDNCRMAKGGSEHHSRPSVGRKNSRCPAHGQGGSAFGFANGGVQHRDGRRTIGRPIDPLACANRGRPVENGTAQRAGTGCGASGGKQPVAVTHAGGRYRFGGHGLHPGQRAHAAQQGVVRHCVHRLFAVVPDEGRQVHPQPRTGGGAGGSQGQDAGA